MTSESTDDKPSPKPPNHDSLLALLVALADSEDTALTAGITLVAGGAVVTGRLVGRKQYRETLTAEIRSAGTDFAGHLADGLDTIAEEETADTAGGDTHEGWYVHLIDAHVYSGAARIPSNRGVAWRGRLSSVAGWNLGAVQDD